MSPSTSSNALWLRFTLSAIILAAALMQLPSFLSDYGQDYAAARGWWHGQDTNSRTADLLAECCAEMAPSYGGMQTAHPPFATLLALPLAWLPWPVARVIWLLLAWAAILGAWLLLRVSPWLCAATASFWIIALGLGTHEPLLFLLLALALTFQARAPRLAAVLVGLCAAIKVYPVLLILGLWISGHRRMALIAVATGVTALVLSELILGVGVTLAWLRFVPVNTLYYVDDIGNGSLVRMVRAVLPSAAPLLVTVVALVLLLLPLIPRIRAGIWLQPLMPVLLLVSPLSWRHYMGLVTIEPAQPFELICLAIAGVAALLIGMHVLPPDNMAPVVQSPLLLALLVMWYRQARSPGPRAGHTDQELRDFQYKEAE